MARKNAVTVSAVPTPARVQTSLRNGEFSNAMKFARELHASAPTSENIALHKHAIAAAAAHFADRDQVTNFYDAMSQAATLMPDDAEWLVERACLLARGGNTEHALQLVDPTVHQRILGHAADRAVRVREKDRLPAELLSGYDAILSAFGHHDAGNEAAVRDALEPIGLRSPFLEWKVMLRGLLAHAAADNARAAENFARLDPNRLPARLAAPLRAAVDPDYKAAISADTATTLLKQHENLTTGPVVEGLRVIARELRRDKPLAPAYRAAKTVLPQLKASAPALVPRLANCFYHAMLQQGEQSDLPRYRELFGSPHDDPHFHKLIAQIGEHINDSAMAHDHWQQYVAWLTGKPAGWPEGVLNRARSLIWVRMGDNARDALELADTEDDFLGFYGPSTRKRKPKPLHPPVEECFRQAVQSSPDWSIASQRLFDALVESNNVVDAESVAREFLHHNPDELPAIRTLAALCQKQGRATEALELWLRALAINPLDKLTRKSAASAIVAEARHQLMFASPAEAEAVLERHRPLLSEESPIALNSLRTVILTKLGQLDEAATTCTQAMAVKGARLGCAYQVMVNMQLAKLKPAEKKAADKYFAAQLAMAPTPQEVTLLLYAYYSYVHDGVIYRGQKTHQKKVLDQVTRCEVAGAPEMDFESLCDFLLFKQHWKLAKKLTSSCMRHFPANPYFLMASVDAGLGLGERGYNLEHRLRRAKQLAESATEPRHRELLERIDEIMKQVAFPIGLLDGFFGGGRY